MDAKQFLNANDTLQSMALMFSEIVGLSYNYLKYIIKYD